jgi:UPF0755 protein
VLLVDGATKVVERVTIREGLRVPQTLDLLAEGTGSPLKQLERAARSGRIGLPPYAGGEPEGYLFPDTYDFGPGLDPTETLTVLTDRFASVADEIGLEAGARRAGFTPHEIVTMASLAQAEAGTPEDFGKVVRVILNRLDDGQPLQFESTIFFATGKFGVFPDDEDYLVDSPYNTYQNPGLPPGPINSPGQDALEAALDPPAGEWRYFVTVNLDTGETKFAETFEEHERNVAELERWRARNPQ